MTKRQIERIIEAKYDDYVTRIIADFKSLPDECRQSGDDGLSDVWEEFKAQVQWQESVFFFPYVETIQQFIAALLHNMAAHEKELLWHKSEGSWDHDDTEKVYPNQMADEVAEEIYRRVCDIAANELLETEEEDLRISGEDLKILHEIGDVLATTLPRLESDPNDEECMQYVVEDLSNLPSLPSAEWSVNIVQHSPDEYVWSITAGEDSIAVDCCPGQNGQPEIEIRWKLRKRLYRNGILAGWLAGASKAVGGGATLELSLD